MLSKGDLVVNPKTQRAVKVGSRTWLNLVKEGLVEGSYTDPKEIYHLAEGDDVSTKIQELNQELPMNQQAVRGRGKYKDKIVRRNRQPTTKSAVKATVRCTASKIKNDPEVYDKLKSCDDFESELERLIMEELLTGNEPVKHRQTRQTRHAPTPPNTPTPRHRPAPTRAGGYYIHDQETETEYEQETEYDQETESESENDNYYY